MIPQVRAVSGWSQHRKDRAVVAVFAAVAYVPMLLTSPGRVSADTKSYLTLDPGAVLRDASSMWDPSVGAGTVPHQNIGYLFPLGPFYWLTDAIGIPDWLTQRFIWGTLVFAAALGTYRLLRWLGWGAAGAAVAACSYGFSPYLLSYLARLSVILGPWAALPWMILFAARAARTRSWRPAAQFAIVVALVGSVNATALVLAGIGPVLWLLADAASGRVTWGAVVRAALRIGALSAAVSLWWIVALRIQGAYGIPILRYTETYESVSSASTPTELVRGAGYWFFYGGDRLDPWVGPSLPYLDNPALIVLGLGLAALAILGFLTPFVGRASAAVLLVIGLAVSAGAAPDDNPSPYGAFFRWFASETTAGLALRSTPRAAPLVILALGMGLGAGTVWVRRELTQRRPAARSTLWVPLAACGLVWLHLFPWFTGTALTPSLLRDGSVPAHVTDLANWLDRPESAGGRVWEMPASDFANYRWGGTVDPALPGLIDRPYLARELVPQGGAGTADLLNAVERRLPEGWFEPESLLPLAQLFGVETIVTRNDLEHERYRLARPGLLWTQVSGTLGTPDHEGPLVTDTPEIPVLDERTLAHPEAAERFPVVAAFDLPAAPVVRTASAAAPVILAGSGDGIVDLAGAGLLDPSRPLLYAATLDDLAAGGDLDAAMIGADAWWVMTDTNRKQGRHWSTVSSNLGALEASGPIQLDDDPGDNALDVFEPGVGRQTVARHEADVADVRASYYGNRIAYTPEDAPWYAIDGDPTTAWRAGVFDTTRGLRWEVDLAVPTPASTVTLLQPVTGAINRFVTEVRITLDDERSLDVVLDERSRTAPGQVVDLPAGEFRQLRIDVLADNVGPLSDYGAQPGVGFAEVVIPGVRDDRVVALAGFDAFEHLDERPTDAQRLTYLLTRQRIDPATSNRTSPEQRLVRRFDVPTDREFVLTGEVRLAADADDAVLDEVLDGEPGAGRADGGERPRAIADRRLPGSPASRGASAIDGDLSTAWRTPFDDVVGATLTIEDVTIGTAGTSPGTTSSTDASSAELTVSWHDDGRHSVPAELTLTDAAGSVQTVALPAVEAVDGVATATVDITPVTAPLDVTITAIDARTTPEYFSGLPQVLPVALAEVRVGSGADDAAAPDTELDAACRDDVVLLDGEPIAVRITGTRQQALARGELTLEACEPVVLTAGSHRIDVTAGSITGFDVDRLVVDGPPPAPVERATEPAASVEVTANDARRVAVTISPSPAPAWLVLEQSWNAGWTARVGDSDLGPPVLINGYANGWLLPGAETDRQVVLEWSPQGPLDLALWFSLAAGIAVLVLALVGRRGSDRPPISVSGDRTPARRPNRLVLAVTLGVVVAVLAGPIVAVGAAVIVGLARRWRWVPAAAVLAAFTVAGGSIAALEWRYDYPADPNWPSRFGWTSTLIWIAVATVVAAAILHAPLVSPTRAHAHHRADSQRGGEHHRGPRPPA